VRFTAKATLQAALMVQSTNPTSHVRLFDKVFVAPAWIMQQ
jgi:hypothetical protein